MSGKREVGVGMERWEVEEEQRADVSSSVFSILRSPMVHGTGVSPTPFPPPPPEPLAMSQSRFVCRWIPPPLFLVTPNPFSPPHVFARGVSCLSATCRMAAFSLNIK